MHPDCLRRADELSENKPELYFREFCPICKDHRSKIFLRGNFNLNKLKPEDFRITDNRYGLCWTFFRCLNCSFVYANPVLSAKSLENYYSQLEDLEYTEESENRKKNFVTILKRIKKLKPKANSILDVGAASGIFLYLASEKGMEIAGVEPSRFLVRKAQQLYGIDLFCGTIEQFPKDKKYAVVTVLDLIEHVAFPDKILGAVSELLVNGGLLVIVTPDVNSFFARLLKKRWWHFRIAHINFFNNRSLRQLLQSHNFQVVLKKRYLWHFSLYYLLSRLIKKERLKSLQKLLKKINLKLPLADSVEIYALKTRED